jgi:hypothetical protein
MDLYVQLMHEGENEAVRLRAIFLIAVRSQQAQHSIAFWLTNFGQQMYPDHWRMTLPHLEAVFRDTANQAQAVRAAALSALSFVAPVRSKKDDGDAREHVERVVCLLSRFLPPYGTKIVHFVYFDLH